MVLYRCPVCGFPNLEANPDNPNPLAFYGGSEICICCGTHFGYHVYPTIPEGPKKAIIERRKAWLRKGAYWWDLVGPPPSDWDWRENLRAIGIDPDTCEPVDEGKQA